MHFRKLFALTFFCPLFLGDCVKGASYTINSIADLKKNINDLECIFAAGVAPDAIGLGFHYGTVLLGENSGGKESQ